MKIEPQAHHQEEEGQADTAENSALLHTGKEQNIYRNRLKKSSSLFFDKGKNNPTHGLTQTKLKTQMSAMMIDSYTLALDTELDKFRAIGVSLDDVVDTKLQKELLDNLRAICRPMNIKRAIRDKLSLHIEKKPITTIKIVNEYLTDILTKWHYLKGIIYIPELWGPSLQKIENNHGAGVLSYFIFLRWIFGLNVLLSALVISFVILPAHQVPQSNFNSTKENATVLELLKKCSKIYSDQEKLNFYASYISSFIQATDHMENTYFFYGSYEDYNTTDSMDYNISLAYILVIIICLLLCLILMANRTSNIMQQSLFHNMSSQRIEAFNVVFASWDYSLKEEVNAKNKHRQIYMNITSDLYEQRFIILYNEIVSHFLERYKLYAMRFGINFLVVCCLWMAAVIIYYITLWSNKYAYSHKGTFNDIFIRYLPCIVLEILNTALPLLFDYVTKYELYRYSTVIAVNLLRTVFLRLASLVVVTASLYWQVTCTPKDSCRVGKWPCSAIACWETFFGQQMYRLLLLNFLVAVGKVLLIEGPKKYLNNDAYPDLVLSKFDIPLNVLDLVYVQTIVWLGFFYAPLLPCMAAVIIFLLFYTKKYSALYFCAPPDQPYKASKSNHFFIIVLMHGYFLSLVPIGYTLTFCEPSRACGPMRLHSYMYPINSLGEQFPYHLNVAYKYVTSTYVLILIIFVLILVVYFCFKHLQAQNSKSEYLTKQLVIERNDKQYLLSEIYKLTGETRLGRRYNLNSTQFQKK